jgi:hypothetical protein
MTTPGIRCGEDDDPAAGGALRALLDGPGFQADPHGLLRRLTASGPAHRCEPPGAPPQWLITGYQEARDVLADPRVSKRSDRAGLEPGWLMSGLRDQAGPGYMLTADPPQHTRLRRAVTRAFTPRQAGALRPQTGQIARRLADGLLSAQAPDLIDGYAAALPVAVICALLGVPSPPPSDQDTFRQASQDIVSPVAGHDRQAAYRRMSQYLAQLVAARQASPGQDLLSALAADTAEDRLDDAELTGTAFLLLIAGHETTTSLIGAILLRLIQRPGLLARSSGPGSWRGCGPTPAWSPPRPRRSCASTAPCRPPPSASPPRTCTSAAPSSAAATCSWCPSPRPTRTRPGSPNPTRCDPPGQPGTSPSATASTTASARRWPGWKPTSPSRHCWPASAPSPSPCPTPTCNGGPAC